MLAKTHGQNARLYNPLPIPSLSWMDVSKDLIMGLLLVQMHMDSVMVVVDQFSKMAYFIACAKTFDAIRIAHLYFIEIMCLH